MTDEIVFYTNPMSRGRMVRWALEETGVAYRTEVLDYASTLKSTAYLAINPMGKVPALTHSGLVITETPAIIAYLSDAFPAAGLAPPLGDMRRGPYLRWMFFAAGPMEAAITTATLGFEVPVERQAMAGFGSLEKVLSVVETAIDPARNGGCAYLTGDAFSAADLYLGSQIAYGLMFKTIEPRPAFSDYVGRIHNRPAAARARELDDALAKAKPQSLGAI